MWIGVRISDDLKMAVVGSPSYFATRGKPKHPRDLQDHDRINYRAERRPFRRAATFEHIRFASGAFQYASCGAPSPTL